jgi:NAD(P)-dependent dehydrogenase (short-subunit alcohol dehydrogenase family)
MLRNGGGAIVNCSSLGGVVGNPGLAAYHAAKHGVLGLTKTAALEYANTRRAASASTPFARGSIDTPMAHSLTRGDPEVLKELVKLEPIGRLGKPEEIAAAVLWLCGPGASYVIGHPLLVDGGYTVQ